MTTLPEGAFAPSELLGTIDAQVDGRTVTGLSMDAAQYLFLPASADLSRLAVTVHTQNCTNPTVELQGSKGIEPLGETVNITELTAADDGLYTLTVRINGEAAGTLPNGILYLKGGDLKDELQAAGKPYRTYEIADFFDGEFFETKKVVYFGR